ncbi:acetylornithine deacetylase (plasmid) [Brucella anthropi]|uniref:Acetylornithine deacetylase (ArgE) n=1 Tax=Brucella anthropi (strain ATCC 49188 / DSM 6882 / CCUG 24695 / JCM 21032 / LMG 3331 / NBRC 15819 / NCTC 12168 / Alc 37) TaxID=439375 RepID=A6X7J3_BRUA4|nr:acetylornithine deacetylase [Brucella anthropi]ABS17197.1 acetylornithine deacetylase (ArgE) [Brucella anthropi ATCC 49188]KAB2729174.1 acetylornithine deacetylase [Brucella anthropi]QQC26856.1 acetylornithine deacetylase [Brucella anthropi]SUB55902.1 Acetylornithine deacetylase [Brucella anthropi]
MNAVEILDQLIGFPSVVGTGNGDIVDWISRYLESHGITASVLPGPEGDRSNLFATIGPADRPGYIFSGHMDVVPAGEAEWLSDPFCLREETGRLYGRGTTDMKGFLAAVLASTPMLQSLKLERPIHIAFSYDEEAGCRGVPHMISRLPELCAKPVGAIIGEPSGLQAVRAHKGKAAARVTVRGRSGHSSRPDLGVNAIHVMTRVMAKAVAEAERLTQGPFEETFAPPYSSLQIGRVGGGQALNIIPELCTVEIEARAISGVRPEELLQAVRDEVEALADSGIDIEWTPLSAYPALFLSQDTSLVALLEQATGKPSRAAVSFGTEAGLFQGAGIDAIICGPGDIDRAHKANEFIELDELMACQRLIETLGRTCTG